MSLHRLGEMPLSMTSEVMQLEPPALSNLDGAKDTQSLCDVLRELGNYMEVDDRPRLAALAHLEEILDRWCALVWSKCSGNNTNNNHIGNSGNVENDNNQHLPRIEFARVALVTFGSYRLGVHGAHSDIDVVALSPPYCARADFFGSLVTLLEQDDNVSHVHPIPFAFTPVIKFTLNGIHVDLLFTRLWDATKLLQYQKGRSSTSVTDSNFTRPSEYVIDDSDLIGMDEAGIRSLNGARLAQILIESVPNLENFRITLRAVKEWAIGHGIYSNVLGFLGGVNCAIMVAWVCQRHPQLSIASLLKVFFQTFVFWQWPLPVALAPIAQIPPPGVAPLPVWNPVTNPRDKLHIMPIITPTYPSMNSSYNVGRPQLRRIQEETSRAVRLLREAEILGVTDWKRLLRGSDFFHQHVHFLHITITATNADDFVPWFRFCESKLRYLINRLDIPDVMAFPFAKFFDRRYNSKGRCLGVGRSDDDCLHESCFFMGLRFAPGLEKVDLQFYTTDFLHMINSWDGRRKGMDLSMAHVVFQDLPSFVFEDQSVQSIRPSNGDIAKRNSSSSSSDRSQTSSSSSGAGGGISAMSLAPVPVVLSPSKRARKTV